MTTARRLTRRALFAALALCTQALPAHADGLRVASWNITYYGGDRHDAIATVVYAQWQGKSFAPDAICLQEMTSASAVQGMVTALNNAPGSPGDWTSAPFHPRTGLSPALVYRTSRLTLAADTIVSQGGPYPNHPRNVVRYDMIPAGYPEPASRISIYPLHFQAFHDDPSYDTRRLSESVALTDDIATLAPGRHIIVGADFNIRRSTDPAHARMVGTPYNTGPLRDPIATPGNWNNNIAFRNIHTQDPSSSGGMDDRLDQILLSPSLVDRRGMDYISATGRPWDLRFFEDPNHSYRAWGNDGSAFNGLLRVNGNAMVGPAIAQAIIDMALGGGHIPVFLDIAMPAKLGTQTTIDLGTVPFTDAHTFEVEIRNAGDTAAWGTGGLSPLRYDLAADAPLTAPVGPFVAEPGQSAAAHTVTLDTTAWPTGGEHTAQITVTSDDPASPTATIDVTFRVAGCSAADQATPFGQLNFYDIARYINRYNAGDPGADIAEPFGTLNAFDLFAMIGLFNAGCP